MSSRIDRRARALTATAAGAGLLAALTSCSTTTKAAPAVPPTAAPVTTPSPNATPTPTPTATPSPTPTNPNDVAIAQAQEAVRRYYTVMDAILRDPSADQSRARQVATSTGLVDAYNRIAFNRARGYHKTGGPTQVVSMDSRVVTLAFKPQQQPPVVPTVRIAVCYNVSDVGFVDASGKSVVTADRKARATERFTVANYSSPDPQGWKVTNDEVKGESCATPST